MPLTADLASDPRANYRPTTSKTLSTNSGSLDTFNDSARWGLSSKAFQIRPMLDFDKPLRSLAGVPVTSAPAREAGAAASPA